MPKLFTTPPAPPRRLSGRWCTVALLLALIPALLMGLSGCGGGGASAAPEAPAERRAQALTASAPGDLLGYVKERLRQRADTLSRNPSANVDGTTSAPPLTLVPGQNSLAGGTATLRSASTVLEAGVDEADLIKTDGTVLLTLNPDARLNDSVAPRLSAHRRLADGSLQATGSLDLLVPAPASLVSRGLFFAESARRVAVLGESITILDQRTCQRLGDCTNANTGVIGAPVALSESSSVDVRLVTAAADTGALTAGNRLSISGRLVGARLIGNSLVIVSTHTPRLAVESLPPTAPAAQREALLASLRTEDLLPTLSINGATPRPLLSDTDCFVQAANASLGIQLTTITTLDLSAANAAPASRCIVGGSEGLYMSATSLVLATTRWVYSAGASIAVYPTQIKTDLHKFSFGGGVVGYRGSGVVDGHLGWDTQRKSSRISEHAGDIRVLTFTGTVGWAEQPSVGTAPSPATLTVLRESAATQTLQELARLPNAQRSAALGKPGEQVYAVRFVGDRAYVVTFRLVDPLYVIDLSNPADPRTVGELVVPGVSESLFPLPGGLLFAVGRDAAVDSGALAGVKVSLLDVADPARPRELDSRILGSRFSHTGLDYTGQALNLLQPDSRMRLALPMLLYAPGANTNSIGTPSQMLQRFEVDTTARTLSVRPSIASASTPGHGLWSERSVQIGNDLYYLSNGGLTRWAW